MSMVKTIKKEVKEGEFASVSEFIRHLVRMYKQEKLLIDLKKGRKEYDEGKATKIDSLEDLIG